MEYDHESHEITDVPEGNAFYWIPEKLAALDGNA